MPNTLQNYMATATQKAADDLVAALMRIPEDTRAWSPDDKGRSALDQVAECAVLSGYTAELIQTRHWSDSNASMFMKEKTEVLQDWDKLQGLLQQNTARLIAAIHTTPDDALVDEIQMPWTKMTLAEVLGYPYWNMSYHQGQINYIASMLGTLD